MRVLLMQVTRCWGSDQWARFSRPATKRHIHSYLEVGAQCHSSFECGGKRRVSRTDACGVKTTIAQSAWLMLDSSIMGDGCGTIS
jgi:hypothetical protein